MICFIKRAPFLFEINTEDNQENAGNQKHHARPRHGTEQVAIGREDVERDEHDAEVDKERGTFLDADLDLQQAKDEQRERADQVTPRFTPEKMA